MPGSLGTHPQVFGRGQPSCGRGRASRASGRELGSVGRDSWSFGLCSAMLWGNEVVIRRTGPTEPRAQGHRQEVLADARLCKVLSAFHTHSKPVSECRRLHPSQARAPGRGKAKDTDKISGGAEEPHSQFRPSDFKGERPSHSAPPAAPSP